MEPGQKVVQGQVVEPEQKEENNTNNNRESSLHSRELSSSSLNGVRSDVRSGRSRSRSLREQFEHGSMQEESTATLGTEEGK